MSRIYYKIVHAVSYAHDSLTTSSSRDINKKEPGLQLIFNDNNKYFDITGSVCVNVELMSV